MADDCESVTVIRDYVPEHAEVTLRIFERAISITALSRYSRAEVKAWLGEPRDLRMWGADREAVNTFVAERDGQVAGFADVSRDGYVDRLFVDPAHGRMGVGSALLRRVEEHAFQRRMRTLTTHASLVARPVRTSSSARPR